MLHTIVTNIVEKGLNFFKGSCSMGVFPRWFFSFIQNVDSRWHSWKNHHFENSCWRRSFIRRPQNFIWQNLGVKIFGKILKGMVIFFKILLYLRIFIYTISNRLGMEISNQSFTLSLRNHERSRPEANL